MSATSVTTGETSRRLLALSGAAFVVLAVLAIVVIGGDTPSSDASAAKVASFYGPHENRQMVAAFVLAAAIPLLIIFGVWLTLVLWPQAPGRRPVWQLVLGGGSVLAAAAFGLSAFVHGALADGGDTLSASTLQGLNVLDGDTWILFNSALGVMMLGAAGSLIPRARAYRVLGWIALILGIALLIPFADFFGLLLTAIWLIVTSIMLFRSEPAPA